MEYLFPRWQPICSSYCNKNTVLETQNVTYRMKLVTWAIRRVPRVEKNFQRLTKVFGSVFGFQCCVSCLLIFFSLFPTVLSTLCFDLWVWMLFWYISPPYYYWCVFLCMNRRNNTWCISVFSFGYEFSFWLT